MSAVVRYRGSHWIRPLVAAFALATVAPAVAAAQTFALSVTNSWTNSGVVTSSPEGINCSPATASNFTGSGTCSVSFPAGTVVTLSATPGTQNTFGGWSGACTGTGLCEVLLDQNRTVGVTFNPTRYTVTLQGAGNGSQHVFEPTGEGLGSPPLACSVVRGVVSAGCATTQFPYGRILRLNHDIITILGLNRWNGTTCSTGSGPVPCNTPVTGPMTVVASVDAPEYQVRSGNAGGSGTVTATGGNTTVNCAISDAGATGACGDIYDKKDGSQITFTATPAAGSKFVGWSGPCSGTGPCQFQAAMPPNVPVLAASFAPAAEFKLTVTNRSLGDGVITSNPSGINCAATPDLPLGRGTCTLTLPAGTVVTLTEAPGTQNTFGGWTGACTGTSTTCQVTLDQDRSVAVTFVPTMYTVTIQGAGNGTAGVYEYDTPFFANPELRCSIIRGVAGATGCVTQVPYGKTLKVRIETNSVGVNQLQTSSQCSTTTISCSAVITGPTTILVTMKSIEHQVRSGMAGGSGTVTGNGNVATFNCAISNAGATGVCGEIFDTRNPTQVLLTATPAAGSQFVGWSGACSGTGTCLLPPGTLAEIAVAFANFAPIVTTPTTYAVTITSAGGKGVGRLTALASDAGTPRLDCQVTPTATNGTCASQYPAGSLVHLESTPNSGSIFTGYSPPCTATTGDCSAPVVDKAITISGTFQLATQSVTVAASAGTGAGTVTSSPAGINCSISNGTASSTCAAPFSYGTGVVLNATPAAGSRFAGWQGACSGTGTCNLTIVDAQTVAARFERSSTTLAVTGTGSGSVASTPAGIACTLASGTPSGTCSASLDAGTSVSLVATPAAGWTFAGWGGACTGTGPCNLTLNANANVSASFVRTPVAVTVAAAGSGNGIVTTSTGAGRCVITNGSAAPTGCSISVEQNSSLTLTADPQFGSTFGGWEGACSGTQLTCNVTPSQATAVTARFVSPHAARDVAMALLGKFTLPADERAQLDRFGNNDGTFNLGDVLALLDRTGEKLTPATTAAINALLQPPAASTPARRTP